MYIYIYMYVFECMYIRIHPASLQLLEKSAVLGSPLCSRLTEVQSRLAQVPAAEGQREERLTPSTLEIPFKRPHIPTNRDHIRPLVEVHCGGLGPTPDFGGTLDVEVSGL